MAERDSARRISRFRPRPQVNTHRKLPVSLHVTILLSRGLAVDEKRVERILSSASPF